MKLVIKLMLMLLVLSLFLPLWIKDPSGKPLMTADDYLSLPDSVARMAGQARAALDSALGRPAADGAGAGTAEAADPGQAEGEYYRWQDERGRWHFSDQVPEHLRDTLAPEKLPEVNNTMDAATAPQPSAPAATGAAPEFDSSITPPLPEGVSKEALEELLEDAHERRMGDEY